MKKLSVLALLLFCCNVFAATVTLSVTPSTKNTDGSVIPATGPGSISRYTAYFGLCTVTNSLPASPASVDITTSLASSVITVSGPGKWCFAATATDTYGVSSDLSNIATIVIVPTVPSPPTVTLIATIAFEALEVKNHLAMLPVGDVPPSSPCDTNNYVVSGGKAYYAVPKGVTVNWYGDVQPQVVFVSCG